ncbi:MAG TPA: TolC family protein [Chthoniobacterales bacterium]|nr:TolC family protein [Chthoniobacterales bacterium]
MSLRKRTQLYFAAVTNFVAVCVSLETMQGQTGGKLSPAPQSSPSSPLPLIPVEKEADPLTGQKALPPEALPPPSKRDLQVIREALGKPLYDPFSRVDLGFSIPRISALKAVRVTLDLNPQILLQKAAVRGSSGTVQTAEGAFDTTITGSVAPNASRNERYIQGKPAPGTSLVPLPNPLVARSGVINYELGLQKTLENGIVINPSVSFSQTANTDYSNQYNDSNQGTVDFTVTIPLAKGGGTLVNKAPEIAARYDLLASVLQLRYSTAQSVLATIQSYWACKAAEETYQLQVEAVESADRLVTMTASLVQADQQASNQLPQILASRAISIASRVQAESDLIAARQNLAVAIGFSAASLPLAPLVADEFPQPPEAERYPGVDKLISSALTLRDDLRSVQQTVKSQKVLMDAAYLNLRPTVNLQLAASYVPLQSRTNLTNTNGNTWQVGAVLSLNWPVENNTAIGLYIQSQATFQNSQITVDSTAMAVESGVITALAQLKAAAANVRLYRDAVRWYQQALAAQERLFQLGQASLVDTITIRQNLINTEISYISAQQTYANSLVQLRFATGTLIFSDQKGSWIDSEVWKMVPFASLKSQ